MRITYKSVAWHAPWTRRVDPKDKLNRAHNYPYAWVSMLIVRHVNSVTTDFVIMPIRFVYAAAASSSESSRNDWVRAGGRLMPAASFRQYGHRFANWSWKSCAVVVACACAGVQNDRDCIVKPFRLLQFAVGWHSWLQNLVKLLKNVHVRLWLPLANNLLMNGLC